MAEYAYCNTRFYKQNKRVCSYLQTLEMDSDHAKLSSSLSQQNQAFQELYFSYLSRASMKLLMSAAIRSCSKS